MRKYYFLSGALLLTGIVSLFAQSGLTGKNVSDLLSLKTESVKSPNSPVDLSNVQPAKEGENKTAQKIRRITGTEPFDPPYIDNFDNDINGYTVENPDNDGSTWTWRGGGYAAYQPAEGNSGNAWLFSPDLKLKGGHKYRVSVDAGSGFYGSEELLEAKWGQGKTAAAMTNDLFGSTAVTWDWTISGAEIIPQTDGSYNIGLHGFCDPGTRLLINSLVVEEVPLETSPDMVTNLKGEPYPDGSLRTIISFTAPAKAIDGSEITGLDYIEIRNNNVVVTTIEDVEPGKDYSWVDNKAFAGLNNDYKVTAFKDGFPGASAEVKVFAGFDAPSAPVDLKALDQVGSVKLTWLPVVGQNGGVINEDDLVYGVYNYIGGGNTELIEELTADQHEYTIENIDTDEGDEQSTKSWIVWVSNPGGTNSSMATLIMGKPYTIPFSQSFKNSTLEGQFVGQANSVISGFWWGQSSYDCQDNDGGAMSLTCLTPANGKFFTGKIALEPNVKAKLSFYYKAEYALPGRIFVTATHRDGTIDGPLFEKDLTVNDNNEWHRVVVDMPEARGTADNVLVEFHAEMTDRPENNLYFDNISVFKDANDDVMATLKAPESIVLGQNAEIVAEMVNIGVNDIAEGAKIQIFVNDEQVGETTLTEPLATLKSVQVPVTFSTNTVNASEEYKVRAVITYDKDENAANNEASVTIVAAKADVKSPKNLGTTESNPVELTWDAPDYEIATVNEDFENYDAWSTDLGGWTTVDNDGGYAAALSAALIYPHQYEQFAFMTWRPLDYFHDNQGVDPHSGDITLVSIYQQDLGRKNVVGSDNWLISPLLSGKKQTISFWVNNKRAYYPRYGMETFDILTSKTDKNVTSFEVLNTYDKSVEGWEEITFEVPEGTRFFAIHQTTQKDYANILMFDDFTYEGSSAPESYNVYCDGKLIANVLEPGFTDNIPDPKATYHYEVTAVYNHGYESEPITTVKSEVVETLEQQDTTFDVYTLDGVQLLKKSSTLRGLQPGMYIINGKKIILRK